MYYLLDRLLHLIQLMSIPLSIVAFAKLSKEAGFPLHMYFGSTFYNTQANTIDKQAAQNDFELASKLDPSSSEVGFNRAALSHSLGEFAEAEKEFSKVLSLTPEDASAYLMRGESYVFYLFSYLLYREVSTIK